MIAQPPQRQLERRVWLVELVEPVSGGNQSVGVLQAGHGLRVDRVHAAERLAELPCERRSRRCEPVVAQDPPGDRLAGHMARHE